MNISEEYKSAIRKRVVTEFIETNSRAPTEAQLRELLNEAYKTYSAIDEVGFSGFDLERPGYSHASSAAIENTNRKALALDQEVLRDRLNGLSDKLENSFRTFLSVLSKNYRNLSRLESRIDSLLLTQGASDTFLAGVEEEFDSHQFVDYAATDATVADGYVTIGRGGYSQLDLTEANMKYTVLAPQGILSKRTSSGIESLLDDDGKFWEYILYTDYESGRITLAIEVEFSEAKYVSDIRLGLSPSSVTKKMVGNFFVSIDGKVFTPVGVADTPLEKQSFLLNIGQHGVKKLQILLSKDAYDTKSPDNKQSIYTFALDSLKVYSDEYKNLLSTVVCGPYPITSLDGEAIAFSKAKLKACTYEPAGTSVDFYLSNDGEVWTFCSHDSSSGDLVFFGYPGFEESIVAQSGSEGIGVLVDDDEDVLALDYATEATLNGYINEDYSDKVPLETIVIKRNVNEDYDTSIILGAERGWILDSVTKRYSTTVYLGASEGRIIDFGPKPVIMNGKPVSGLVRVLPGYTVFQVDDINFGIVSSGITDLTSLKAADPLYPFNHKLLISGYDYPNSFSGEKAYLGLDEFFGVKLRYMSPDYFAFLEPTDPNYFKVFTIEEVDDRLYFKVKVNKTDASWSNELFGMSWIFQDSSSSQLWVKAILTSDSKQNTPKLESFSVQVI